MKTIQFDDRAYKKLVKEFDENIDNQETYYELYYFYKRNFEELATLVDDALYRQE